MPTPCEAAVLAGSETVSRIDGDFVAQSMGVHALRGREERVEVFLISDA